MRGASPGRARRSRLARLAYAIVSASSHPNPTAHTATESGAVTLTSLGRIDTTNRDRERHEDDRLLEEQPARRIRGRRGMQAQDEDVVEPASGARVRRDPSRDEDAPERDQGAQRPDVPGAPLGVHEPAPDPQRRCRPPRRSPRRSDIVRIIAPADRSTHGPAITPHTRQMSSHDTTIVTTAETTSVPANTRPASFPSRADLGEDLVHAAVPPTAHRGISRARRAGPRAGRSVRPAPGSR